MNEEEYEKLEDLRFHALRNKTTREFFTNRNGEFMFDDVGNVKRSVAYYNNVLAKYHFYPKIELDEWEFVELKVTVVGE